MPSTSRATYPGPPLLPSVLPYLTTHQPPVSHHLTRIMNADRAESGDKLRHGPCAKQYVDLEDCAADKKVRSHGVSPDRRARLRYHDGRIVVLLHMIPLSSQFFPLCVIIILGLLVRRKRWSVVRDRPTF